MNVAGGIRLAESSIDAALAAALYSARTDLPVGANTAIFGELSLAGEVRSVGKTRQRIKAAENLGFTDVITPDDDDGKVKISDIKSLVKEIFRK